MEKGDSAPSAPPPPYSSLDYDADVQSASTRPFASRPTYPPAGATVYPQPESKYPVRSIAFTVGQDGYPAGSSGFSRPQSGEYPQDPSKYPNDAVGFPQQPGHIHLHPQPAVQLQEGTSKLEYHQQPVVTVVAPSAENFGKQMAVSCVAVILFFPLGILALILAVMADRKAKTNRRLGHMLGILSYVVAILGILCLPICIALLVIFANSRRRYY